MDDEAKRKRHVAACLRYYTRAAATLGVADLTEDDLRWLENIAGEFLDWSNDPVARRICAKLNTLILERMECESD